MRECYVTLNIKDCINNIKNLIPKTLNGTSVHSYVSDAPLSDKGLALYIMRTVKDNLSGDERLELFYNISALQSILQSTNICTNIDQIRQIEAQAATEGIEFDMDVLNEIAQQGVTINFTDNNKMYCISVFKNNSKYLAVGLDLCYKNGPSKVVFMHNDIILWNKFNNNMYICDPMGDHRVTVENEPLNCFKFKKDVIQEKISAYHAYTLVYGESNEPSRYDMIGSRLSAVLVVQEVYKLYKQLKDNVKTVEYKVNNKEVKENVYKTHTANTYLEDDVVNRLVDLTAVKTKYVGRKYKALGGHHASPIEHTVSGHYRHYKNGKVIFVGSFKRGKKKEYFEVTTNLV